MTVINMKVNDVAWSPRTALLRSKIKFLKMDKLINCYVQCVFCFVVYTQEDSGNFCSSKIESRKMLISMVMIRVIFNATLSNISVISWRLG